jgi:hypothetical protein
MAGVTTQFGIMEVGATATRNVSLTSATVVRDPVLETRIFMLPDGKKVGYLLFNDHIATAEEQLYAAVNGFKNVGIDDLVLDVRYNGGGYLYIASELASMIGGDAVQNKVFEKLIFNSKHPGKTADPDNTLNFLSFTTKFEALPQLNLPRVFVLTGSGTCSASEAIINGLEPFVQVIRIGGTTCGKPYGMMQTNNCGKAYFAIEFKGVNSLGTANYENGFAPTCAVSDDLEHALGDTSERLLQTALSYRDSNSCPASSVTRSLSVRYAPLLVHEPVSRPWRTSRIAK